MQIWLLALAGAVAPAPAKVLAASSSNTTATATAAAPGVPKQPVALDPPGKAPAPLVLEPPKKAKVVSLAAPKKPAVLSPPARQATGWKAANAEALAAHHNVKTALVEPGKPVVLDPPANATALVAPGKPVVLDPPSNATALVAPGKPVVLDPPGKAADEAPAVPEKPVALDPPSKAAETPLLLKSPENSTGVALAVEDPNSGHEIHDMIHEAHKSMCEDGRMDSPHCEKFRSTLDDMHQQINEMHEEHQAAMTETAEDGAVEGAAAEAAAPVETGEVSYTTEVESVKPHDPVIKKHEYPYKTGPCASGVAAVALLFSGLLFA
jgi:hypothetical protein